MGYTSVENKEPIKDEDGSEVQVAYSVIHNNIRLGVQSEGWGLDGEILLSSVRALELVNLLLYSVERVERAHLK